MTRISKLNFITVMFLIASLLPQQSAAGERRILKWVDSKGVTHYGDKLPTQEAGRSSSVMNKDGIIIKKNESYNPNVDAKQEVVVSTEKVRQDNALLASYSSAEEIDLAQDRNLKSDQLALQTLKQRLVEAEESIKQISLKYAGKKIPTNIFDELDTNKKRIASTKSNIEAIEKNIAQTKLRFSAYKARYEELRPRDQSLTYIKVNKRTLSELEAWKLEATNRLNYYLDQAASYKRAGAKLPDNLVQGMQQANEEIVRANVEIVKIKQNINKSEQIFSK